MNSRILLSIAFIVPPVAHAQAHPGASGSALSRVPSVDACVVQTFDSNRFVNLSNQCTYNIVLRVYFGSDLSSSTITLGADGSAFPTGYSSDDMQHRGPIHIYACPADHPDVRDLNGQKISGADKPYLCQQAPLL